MLSTIANTLRPVSRSTPSHLRFASSHATRTVSPLLDGPSSSSTHPAKLHVQPKDTLPDDKMRALVDLYHDSASYIKKENLDNVIDEVFVLKRVHQLPYNPEGSFIHLRKELGKLVNQPKFAQMPAPAKHDANRAEVTTGDTWSEMRSPRAASVLCTLYGVNQRSRPGYDALKDEVEGVRVQVSETTNGGEEPSADVGRASEEAQVDKMNA